MKGLCHYCGKKGTTRDHIVPRSLLRDRTDLRRNDHQKNFVIACERCNRLKGHLRSDCPCPICLMAWVLFGPDGWQDIEIVRICRVL